MKLNHDLLFIGAVLFWLSAWLPVTEPGGLWLGWAALGLTFLGLALAHRGARLRLWGRRMFSVLAIAALGASILAFGAGAFTTMAAGILLFFMTIGWSALATALAGRLQMRPTDTGGSARIRGIDFALLALSACAVGIPVWGWFGSEALFFFVGFLVAVGWSALAAADLMPAREPYDSTFFWGGVVVLVMLGSLSWLSALRMATHAGVRAGPADACIVIHDAPGEYRRLSTIWEMRLPDFISTDTGQTGTQIYDYHAVLFVPGDPPLAYNWSKWRMRFEGPLDMEQNKYMVPRSCPD